MGVQQYHIYLHSVERVRFAKAWELNLNQSLTCLPD
jgi:hypothetical protein